jgi:hypothetical protein
LQSFFKKKKEKEKLPRSAQSFNLFCQIVIFFHKHMKKQECSSQAILSSKLHGRRCGLATSLGEES